MQAVTLRITEIFHSLQGESRSQGLPTVFVRLTGCPLRCNYCDTAYAFSGGELLPIAEIMRQVSQHPKGYVTVTGGEPLAQANCLPLMRELCDQGYQVSLETSGALSIAEVDPRVVIVLDLKTPASGEVGKNDYGNIALLKASDQVKFVICNRDDYQWARMQVDVHRLLQRVDDVLFSPSYGEVEPRDLAQWILDDGLQVRMQMQLHKLLWRDQPGH